MSDFDGFECLDCNIDTASHDEYYMVWDNLWLEAVGDFDSGMLCIGCLESRLGLTLTKWDFTDAPVNDLGGWEKSPRLEARLRNDK